MVHNNKHHGCANNISEWWISSINKNGLSWIQAPHGNTIKALNTYLTILYNQNMQDQDIYIAVKGPLQFTFDPSLIYTISIQDTVKPRYMYHKLLAKYLQELELEPQTWNFYQQQLKNGILVQEKSFNTTSNGNYKWTCNDKTGAVEFYPIWNFTILPIDITVTLWATF